VSDASSDKAQPQVEDLENALRDPVKRARLAAALSQNVHGSREALSAWQRYRPFLAGLASGAVVVFAFLVPSIQEQWNLYRSGKVVDQYARIAQRLFDQQKYTPAEQAFQKAVEMSEGRRLDLVEAQMRAHVQRVNENPEWRGTVPEDISDGDFLYLLEIQAGMTRARERAQTLAAFGVWLASVGRLDDAKLRVEEALALDPRNADAHVNLGNILDGRGEEGAAEAEYRRAIEIDPRHPGAHYNLGLALLEAGHPVEAEASLRAYVALKPGEAQGRQRLAEALEAQGRSDEAAVLRRSRFSVPALQPTPAASP
jgi:tetratricopeptide (TPR) repeat protein